MKIILSIFIGLSFVAFAQLDAVAQDRQVTIILVRHAEKALEAGPASSGK